MDKDFHSEVDKAQYVLLDKNNKVADIAKLIHMAPSTLYTYRQDITKVRRMTWQQVHDLAEFYNQKYRKEV